MHTKSETTQKYSCPNCGSKVYAWVEEVIEHRAHIYPKTGQMLKTIKKVSFGNATGCSGVSCSNCDWKEEPIPDLFLEEMDKGGFDQLFKSAEGC